MLLLLQNPSGYEYEDYLEKNAIMPNRLKFMTKEVPMALVSKLILAIRKTVA